jgi:N-sulfoglucosamine sulfohydrolase
MRAVSTTMTRSQTSRLFLGLVCLATANGSGASPGAGRAPESRPNVLFCIADDASYPFLGAYGCKWVKTPAFDRVAREGLLFKNAYTPNAKCAPSRSSILTGRNSWQLDAACNHSPLFPARFKTYPEALGEHGYFVGKTGKGWAPGNEGKVNGQPRHLAGPGFDERKLSPPTSGIAGTDYAANFRDFLEAVPQGKPWCFWYGGFEPHRKYEYGSGAAKGGKKISDIDAVPAFWPDNAVVRHDLLDYALELEHFDCHLGRMLELLAARGDLTNTLVLVTADNGMPFPRVKGQEYELSNHLPLAIMWPKGIRRPGRVVEDYVAFIDFAPTFLEAAGVGWESSGMLPTPGHSLTDIFASDKSGRVNPKRDHVLIGKERHDVGRPHDWGYPIRGILKNGLLYLHNYETNRWPAGNPETGYLDCDGSPTKSAILEAHRKNPGDPLWALSFGKRAGEELFAVELDRACMTNLANRAEYAPRLAELREQLCGELREQEDPRQLGHGEVLEQYPYSSPAVRNFYERHLRGEALKTDWVNPSDFEPKPLD